MSLGELSAELSPVRLSSFGLRREPPRPLEHREPGYEERYDFDTLFYDVFAAADGRAILGISPPLLNCEPQVRAALFRRDPGGEPLPHRVSASRYGSLVRIDVPEGAIPPAISMQMGGRVLTIPVRHSNCGAFAGCRVVFLISKDNPIAWIRDWARFNVRVHGADAAILYDNGSSRYDTSQLRDALAAVDGLKASLVVDWRFPFGTGHGPNGERDSIYGQNGALAHLRFKHCARASAVLNSDIDELVVPLDGRSVFEHLAASGEPCLTYAGRWVTAVRSSLRSLAWLPWHRTGEQIRHTDCVYIEKSDIAYPNKWVADPRQCADDVLWLTHSVRGLPGAAAAAGDKRRPTTQAIVFRHCRQISTNWKYDRSRLPKSGKRLRYDHELARALAAAFPDRRIARE